MRKHLSLSFAICLISALACAQNKPALKSAPSGAKPVTSPKSSPSFAETTEWITYRMRNAGYSLTRINNVGLEAKESHTVAISFEGCKMTFEYRAERSSKYMADKPESEDTTQWKGSAQLKQLAAPSTTTLPFSAVRQTSGPKVLWWLTLRSQSRKSSAFSAEIIFTHVIPGLDYTNVTRETLADDYALGVPFTDSELTERMRKAFAHAITRCGGGGKEEKEPF